jgi:hypothetical protein
MTAALIRIDDKKIRREAFAAAQKLLRKLETLESHVRIFESHDQRQFLDWQEVTFRSQRAQLERLQEQLERLRDTHTRIVVLATLADLPFETAARQIFEEEQQFEHGTANVRESIHTKWEERLRLAELQQAEIDRKERERLNRRRAREERQRDEEDAEQRRILESVAQLSDEELFESCQSPRRANDWLWRSLWEARQTGDAELFFRVWDSTHPKLQKTFARDFHKSFGLDFTDVAAGMRAAQDEIRQNKEAPASRFEKLKLLYRQLVRRLHPDLRTEEMTAWQKSAWMRAQEAYRNKDLKEIEKLLQLIFLRSGDLNSLQLSEIVASKEWLLGELAQLEASVRGMKRSAAWGFSRRKDYAPVRRKVERQLEKSRQELDRETEALELRLNHWRNAGDPAAKAESRLEPKADR